MFTCLTSHLDPRKIFIFLGSSLEFYFKNARGKKIWNHHPTFSSSIFRQSGNKKGGDSEESSLSYILLSWLGEGEELKKTTKLLEINRYSFMASLLSKSPNSNATISHRGTLPLIFRNTVPLQRCIGNVFTGPVEVFKL